MPKKMFGTDGVRGEANQWPMTPDAVLQLAIATGKHFIDSCEGSRAGHPKFTVVIGKDTRLSGYMVESALVAGFVTMGIDVILLGPIPTPGIAVLTRSLRADLGVMISASHNPYTDNGIKFFKSDGQKITPKDERAIEAYVKNPPALPPATAFGKAKRLDDALGRYIEFAKATFPRGQRLDGLRIVVDTANGAAYKVAPRVLWELGAEVIVIGDDPQGDNINANCGATHPEYLVSKVLEHEADIGIALDGDADRVILVDEKGTVVDGDQLMAAIAQRWHARGMLRGNGVVATTMSNLGFERFLESKGLTLFRAAVGDRNVSLMMQEKGCNVGGEQSGHVVLSDYCTTGDGLIAALQILSLIQETKQKASQLLSVFTPVPQKLHNIRLKKPLNFDDPALSKAIDRAETALGLSGRLLVRPSGTEPLVRLMAQGDDELLLTTVLHELADVVETMQFEESA
ncbi:MAG: phosphoglucosamine mutase [Alphaproteobacteria bacterium]|nr:phosphoglucosamine mutase [Alphaproteobacteria bacterium]